jgi:hypothetical protein
MAVATNRLTITLPTDDGALEPYTLSEVPIVERVDRAISSRIAYAAPHVVCDPLRVTPGVDAQLDWEATLATRRDLWRCGIGVAEAMDTSERGRHGLDWEAAQELIRRSCAEAMAAGGRIACGAGTDQLDGGSRARLDEVVGAYEEQMEFIESHGSSVIVRASRELARAARSRDDYLAVYSRLIEAAQRPVIVHWKATVFDPELTGYWGSGSPDETIDTLLLLADGHAAKIDGFKVSILDADTEVAFRSRLPVGIRVYTGDDHDYPSLILGDEHRYSDALLGVFQPLAPIASAALHALDQADAAGYLRRMESTVPLARRMFETPAYRYTVGVVFISYLSGQQEHFRMVTGFEGMRSVTHLAQLFRLADGIGLLPDRELAVERMRRILAVCGIG